MRLVIPNTGKELRHFIKALSHTFDSYHGAKKEKKVFLYVCQTYIALVNEYSPSIGSPDLKLCLCVLRSHMFKVDPITEPMVYKIDGDSILKLLNSHIEPDIIQLEIILPDSEEERKMEFSYETSDNSGCKFSLYTQIETQDWPFYGGGLTPELFSNHTRILDFFQVPPHFIKSLEYVKNYVDIWFCLTPDGIKLKKIEGKFVIDEHRLPTLEQNYDYYQLSEALKGNTAICIRTEPFFRHLELATRENIKSSIKIALIFDELETERVKNSYLIMETVGQKKQIIESYQILARSQLFENRQQMIELPSSIQKPIILPHRDTKRQEAQPEVMLNRFYGKNYEEQFSKRFAHREELQFNSQKPHYEMPKKFKIQL